MLLSFPTPHPHPLPRPGDLLFLLNLVKYALEEFCTEKLGVVKNALHTGKTDANDKTYLSLSNDRVELIYPPLTTGWNFVGFGGFIFTVLLSPDSRRLDNDCLASVCTARAEVV